MADLATLVIAVDSTDVSRADKALDKLSGSADFAEKMVKRLAGAWASLKIAEHAMEAAKLSARYDMLGVSMNVVGNNAGYTAAQMAKFEEGLERTGISMVGSREALTKLAAANLDLSKSSDLARVAQDAARIGNINSTEAFGRLVQGIQSGEQEILRTMGMNVQWEAGYKKLAETMGKSADQLTAQDKLNSRLATVLDEGAKRAGVYEASLGMVGGQMLSMQRYAENLEVSIGRVFGPALQVGVNALTFALSEMQKYTDRNKQELDLLGGAAGQMAEELVQAGRSVWGLGSDVSENIDGLLLLRRTLQGIAGMAALVTDSFNGIRVAAHDVASLSAKGTGKGFSWMAKFADKVPGGEGFASALEMLAWQSRKASDIAWNGGDKIANRQLAVERWLENLDKINNAKPWTDKLGKPGGTLGNTPGGAKAPEGLTEYGREVQRLQEQLRGLTMSEEDAYRAKLQLMDDGAKGSTDKAMNLWKQIKGLQEEQELQAAITWGAGRIAEERLKEQTKLEQERKRLMEEGAKVTESLYTPAERYAKELEHLNALYAAGAIGQGTLNRKMAELDPLMGPAIQAMNNFGDSAADAFGRWAAGMDNAALSFNRLVQSMMADAARLYAQQGMKTLLGLMLDGIFGKNGATVATSSIPSGLGSGLLGGALNGLFGGPRASGGPVYGGTSYLVGERGPEIFTPSSSGAITPNHAIGGQVVNQISVNVTESGVSTSVNAGARGENIAKSLKQQMNEWAMNEMRPGGLLMNVGR